MTAVTNAGELWLFLVFGYIATVTVELPVLYVGLSARHSKSQRLTAGLLLTAFTYPVVVLVLPAVFTLLHLLHLQSRTIYLLVAETFAPVAEVLFFRFITNKTMFAKLDRDALVIVIANLTSFLLGEAFLSRWVFEHLRS